MRRGPTIFISHFRLHVLHQAKVKRAQWISIAFRSDNCRDFCGPHVGGARVSQEASSEVSPLC